MSLAIDNQNKFVLISSLILDYCRLNFPCPVNLDNESIYKAAYEFHLDEFINSMEDMFEPTITWLTDEQYIRKSTDDKYSITEKGLASLEHKVKPAPMIFKFFTKKTGNEYSFFKETGWEDEKKLKCTGPALSLLPENWYQFD